MRPATPTQARLLHLLRRAGEGGATTRSLSEWTGVAPGTVLRALRLLRIRGAVSSSIHPTSARTLLWEIKESA